MERPTQFISESRSYMCKSEVAWVCVALVTQFSFSDLSGSWLLIQLLHLDNVMH